MSLNQSERSPRSPVEEDDKRSVLNREHLRHLVFTPHARSFMVSARASGNPSSVGDLVAAGRADRPAFPAEELGDRLA